MIKTNYKIEKERERFTVTEFGKVISKGFMNIEDALHSVWILNNSIKDDFYIEIEKIVYLNIEIRFNS
jgi:TATA-box binding protein (TBP) (component of TFIID and TFIIIB)